MKILQCNPWYKQTKRKNHEIISLDVERALTKSNPFMLNVLERARIQCTYLNTVKGLYWKPMANTKLNGEEFKAIEQKAGSKYKDFFNGAKWEPSVKIP